LSPSSPSIIGTKIDGGVAKWTLITLHFLSLFMSYFASSAQDRCGPIGESGVPVSLTLPLRAHAHAPKGPTNLTTRDKMRERKGHHGTPSAAVCLCLPLFVPSDCGSRARVLTRFRPSSFDGHIGTEKGRQLAMRRLRAIVTGMPTPTSERWSGRTGAYGEDIRLSAPIPDRGRAGRRGLSDRAGSTVREM
jgi:hypothetical protein